MNRPSSELSALGQAIALALDVVSLYLHVHVGNFNFIRQAIFVCAEETMTFDCIGIVHATDGDKGVRAISSLHIHICPIFSASSN